LAQQKYFKRTTAVYENEEFISQTHRLAGDVDYILKVRVKNARAYDYFYQSLI